MIDPEGPVVEQKEISIVELESGRDTLPLQVRESR